MTRSTLVVRSSVAVTAALLVAACGSSSKSSSSSSTPSPAMPSMSMDASTAAAPTESAATSAAETAAAAAGEPVIHIKGFAFGAPSAPVKANSKFMVINDDGVAHTYETVQSGIFDSGNIPGGGSKEVTAGAAGTFQIKCDYHSSMHGSLTVT